MEINIKTSGVHHITLRVTNLERSRQFYCDLLGFPILLEAENFFVFLAGSTAIVLKVAEPTTSLDGDSIPTLTALDHIALACEDETELRRVTGALAVAGILNSGIKTDKFTGKQYVAFTDPDGICWQLYMT